MTVVTKALVSIKWLYKWFPLIALLAALIITLDFRLSAAILPGYNLFDDKRIVEIALLALGSLYLALSNQTRNNVYAIYSQFSDLIKLSLFMILCLGIGSALNAALPTMAFVEVSTYVLLFYFALLIAALRQQQPQFFDKALSLIILLSAALYSVVFGEVLLQKFLQHKNLLYFPGFVNIRFFDHLALWTLFFLILPMRYFKANTVNKFIVSIIAISWVALVCFSFSKGAFISLAVALTLTTLQYRRRCWSWLRWQLGFIIGGILLYFAVFYVLPHLAGIHFRAPIASSINSSKNSRLELWWYAFKLFKTSPLLGVGPMHFALHRNIMAAHPHNAIILLVTEWGVIAGLLMLFVAIYASWRWLQKPCDDQQATPWLRYSLNATLIAVLIESMLSGIIVMPLSQLLLAVVIGWTIGIKSTCHRNKKNTLLAVLLLLPALLATGCLLIYFYQTLPHLSQTEVQWYLRQANQGNAVASYPRFWMQGLLH